jgi:cytidylate kinase
MRETIAIAIDGPAASGKGTVARRVAAALGYAYIDTGAMYRAVGRAVLDAGRSPMDAAFAGEVASRLRIGFSWDGGALKVSVDGEDVTARIRSEEAGRAASAVAVHPGVRAALLQAQRDLASSGGVVMDGRDIGTVVLPYAQLKVYLDADLDVRARRRHAEHAETPFEDIRRDLEARDAQDSGRATAPLRQAEDAVRVDSTGMDIDAVVAHVVALARAREERR